MSKIFKFILALFKYSIWGRSSNYR